MRMSTVMKKKNHSKKPKLDHEPVRAMAEPPRKTYQDARQKAAAERCAKNAPSLSKGPEPPPTANNVDVHPLVPYPVSLPTKVEVEALEALLTSVSPSMTQTPQTEPLPSPPPSQKSPVPKNLLPPVPTAQEMICLFHLTSELQRRISAKGWDYIKCLEELCLYWVPTAETAVISAQGLSRKVDFRLCPCWSLMWRYNGWPI